MEKLWWDRALAFCVTGIQVDLPVSEGPDPARVLAALQERGIERSSQRHPIPGPLRTGLPAAQLAAAEQQIVRLAGLTVAPPSVRSARGPSEAERRLMADRPPHW